MTRCWHCSQRVPPLACVFQRGCLALELARRGPQRLRIFLSGRAGTSTALVTVVQLLEKQSCAHHCNPAAPTSTAPALQPSCGTAEQGPTFVLSVSCPPRPLPLDLPTYLCCDPLPGLQAAGSSRTKQSMAMWSARTAMSLSLHSLALWRHCASLQAQEGMCQQVLARAGIPPPLIPNCMHSALSLLDSHLCVQLQWRSVRLFTLCSWYLASWGAIWCSHLRRCLLHLHPLPGPGESREVRGIPSSDSTSLRPWATPAGVCTCCPQYQLTLLPLSLHSWHGSGSTLCCGWAGSNAAIPRVC